MGVGYAWGVPEGLFTGEVEAFRAEVCRFLRQELDPARTAGRVDPSDRTGLDHDFERALQRRAGERGYLAVSLDPSVGILLNVSEDHLDRHGTLAAYAAIKERLVAGVAPGGTSIVGVDDNWGQAAADRIERAGRAVVRVSVRRPLPYGRWPLRLQVAGSPSSAPCSSWASCRRASTAASGRSPGRWGSRC